MATMEVEFFRTQLQERRQKLEEAIATSPRDAQLAQLLQAVDSALEQVEKGTYGLCEECHESIEKQRLIADPLVRFCLDHLTTEQQRLLEKDLQLAARIQAGLLPKRDFSFPGWEVHYHYEPAGPVSGDYCDLIASQNHGGDVFFLVGDVSGKGVAASMIMTQLHTMFRSLITVRQRVDQMVALANRMFCESTISGLYATLVCGRATRSGEVELCNAGHWPALLVRKGDVTHLEATGLPLGMFCDSQYALKQARLKPGDALFLYTDGVSEARDRAHGEYGVPRLAQFVGQRHGLPPEALIAACLQEVKSFSAGVPKGDDLTIMVLRRAG
jgi:sigma-B regulation protein RsbU (phosphoserine phosphatase)